VRALHDRGEKRAHIEQWLMSQRYPSVGVQSLFGARAAESVHDRRIRSFALTYDAPVSGAALWQGLERLIDRHGEKLLRIKGIVNAQGQTQPKVIHIVQHVLYPVQTLPQWPDDDRRTRLVFILLDLDLQDVRAVLDDCLILDCNRE
jgi:G3E family GTPase